MEQRENEHLAPGAFILFGFTRRWLDKLAQAEREGGWWNLDALSQNGKTTANKHYRDQKRTEKLETGTTIVPVALTCAAEGERVLVAALADSIGGARLVRQPQRSLAVARALAKVGTRLIVVNNGHAMEWRQWQTLLALEELYKSFGVDPAIVLSSINRNVGLASARTHDGTTDQLRRRIRFEHVPGNDKKDVRAGLELLARRDHPGLLKTDLLEQADLVFELLTDGLFASSESRVVTVDLIELFRRVVAAHRRSPGGGTEEPIRMAHAHLVQSRTQKAKGERAA